ncbi:hypothetical protein [Polluticaenibacter yanchengensis]|uniref:Secreted protein n=1 Tax=Polluticaenibacter yanchengensis TaxID=3014562 RepID=A0ABT4UKI8_9BACT|nr:hypothetical protein [Chitinophagaceae bacterium LY-5]
MQLFFFFFYGLSARDSFSAFVRAIPGSLTLGAKHRLLRQPPCISRSQASLVFLPGEWMVYFNKDEKKSFIDEEKDFYR